MSIALGSEEISLVHQARAAIFALQHGTQRIETRCIKLKEAYMGRDL